MHYSKCKMLYLIYTFPALLRGWLSGVSFNGLCYFAGIPYMHRIFDGNKGDENHGYQHHKG